MTAVTGTVGIAERQSIATHLSELRAALEEQRAFREDQLADLAGMPGGGSAIVMDDAHNEVADALRAGAAEALFAIKAAIARIETGSYGRCESCNREIPLERLEILPIAALCIRCARARDVRAANR